VPGEPAFGLRRPPRLDAAAFAPAPAPAPQTDAGRLPWLFSPKDAPPPFKDGTIRFFSAVGPANEVREILRRIVTEKIPLDDVEIIHPPGPNYPSLLYALSTKAGLPATFSEGIPLALLRPAHV
jgi:ATP-dependent helicase/nuclease subunit B